MPHLKISGNLSYTHHWGFISKIAGAVCFLSTRHYLSSLPCVTHFSPLLSHSRDPLLQGNANWPRKYVVVIITFLNTDLFKAVYLRAFLAVRLSYYITFKLCLTSSAISPQQMHLWPSSFHSWAENLKSAEECSWDLFLVRNAPRPIQRNWANQCRR